MLQQETEAPRKRGPKPKPASELALATRKNVSMDTEAQQVLAGIQDSLQHKLGFKPTLTQTILWLGKLYSAYSL
jgi:hypothetical protein